MIVPQFLGRPEFIDELSLLALDVGARFVEIALMIDRDLAQDAFNERSATARDQTQRDAAALVERSQADNAIGEMFDRYVALLEQRPLSRRIEVTRGNIEGTSTRPFAVSSRNSPPINTDVGAGLTVGCTDR